MATYEGMGFCDSSEYVGAFANRLQQNEITRDELYVARFQVEGHRDKAFRIIGRAGLMIDLPDRMFLNFELLDDDLRPIQLSTFAGHIQDGLWNPCIEVVCYPTKGEEARMRNACLADYEEGTDWDLDVNVGLFLERESTAGLSL